MSGPSARCELPARAATTWTDDTSQGPGHGRSVQLDRGRRARTGGATVSAVVLALAVSGCGNWITAHETGRVGITVDPAGSPVIAVLTCERSTPVVLMHEGRSESLADDEPNVQRGQWRAREPFTGVRTFSIADPGDQWRTDSTPGALEDDRLFIVDGGAVEDEDASLGGVTFRAEDLAAVTSDQVLVREGDLESLGAFGDYECSDDW